MNKATEVTAAIKAAWEKANELSHSISIYSARDLMQVHLAELRDLEQIPGEMEIREFSNPSESNPYSHEASKMVEGVKFFCVIQRAQYEELQKAS